jgi:predicted AlkP superfamily phosphohydrolase/phosphomutase
MELGESDSVKSLLPQGLQARVRRRIRQGRSSFKNDLLETIDWKKTRAFFPGVPLQGIVLPRAGRDTPAGFSSEAERVALRDRIRRELEQLIGPDGGTVVDRVWTREELYDGPYTELAPDLIFVARDYSCLGRPVLGARSWFRDSTAGANGFHRMGGVILALGEGIRAGVRIGDCEILDMTPTLLHALGEPVPDDMDGRVVRELFEPDWWRSHPPRYCEARSFEEPDSPHRSSEDEGLKDRLRALGYLD